ncbi:hypothetical protein KEM52_005566, partial [Ascosphaera acerosa]
MPFMHGGGKPFQCSEFSLIAEYDTEIELHFKMPDDTICTQSVSCGPEPTTVRNEKCGGAIGLGFNWSASANATISGGHNSTTSGNYNGSGYGSGNGTASGNDNGSGSGSGNGTTYGEGNGSGSGSGSGSGGGVSI